jgi:hypothetical protein
MHPGSLRCSFVAYARYAASLVALRSGRLGARALPIHRSQATSRHAMSTLEATNEKA